MLTMDDIIREGHPTLRKTAEEVTFPLNETDQKTGNDMLTFLKNSQDPETAEKYALRGGVGLAAPQLNIGKRIIAILIPANDEDQTKAGVSLVMYNPKVVSHSVQDACLAEGEGCLSVDRDVKGYVVRHQKITVSYSDINGEKHKLRLKGYDAIVVQHEIDHLNGIMFYDHINEANPFAISREVIIIE